ncbi:unnamed protein product [Didymodactylos carnosus]|uniref:NAD(P)(+)--arginine ADP-ribosyltransferase n=1 Tax=Didymodactylos carnosus TaxID=1234261 RepID=A0A814XAA3_9BILA|nr:unnamed protein product [Didymodactylos carnosus]CAF3980416.1 unnamed protein product [Didymodactylos carnosus]
MAKRYPDDPCDLKQYSRLLDIKNEQITLLSPIEGYQNKPLLPLEIACEPIEYLVPDIQRHVHLAKNNSSQQVSSDGLTHDEQASICLYTMEWEPHEQRLYFVLNRTLWSEDRQQLKPWFDYLKLFLTALFKLPSIVTTVWRGIKLDLSSDYLEEQIYTWYGFSSCTNSLAILESDQFLGKTGTRTLFNIECDNGKVIRQFSNYNAEHEILLLPAIQFQVKSNSNLGNGLNIIHLKEIKPIYPLLESPFEKGSTAKIQQSNEDISIEVEELNEIMNQLLDEIKINQPSQQQQQQHYPSHHNKELEDEINKQKTETWLNLDKRQITDQDMILLSNELKINTKWTTMYLRWNQITSVGIQYLCEGLEKNETITTITFSTNQLGDMGIKILSQFLKTNKILSRIYLNNNQITDEGVSYIAEMLTENKTLTELILDENFIGDIGMNTISLALIQNSSLSVFYIQENKITDKSIDIIKTLCNINDTLWYLYLSDNQISDNGQKQLQQGITENKCNFIRTPYPL